MKSLSSVERHVTKVARSRTLGVIGVVSLVLSAFACTPEKPPVVPEGGGPIATASASAAPAGPDVYAPQGPFTEEAFAKVETAPLAAGALTLPAPPSGVVAPPAMCAEALRIKASEVPKCDDRASALAALDSALAKVPEASGDAASAEESAVKSRDAALAILEGCSGLPAGLVRALRAELLPAACGDVLAEPLLKNPPKDLRADVHEALFGLALAARFARAGGAPPTLAAPFTRARVEKHTKGPLAKWMKDVATAVQEMSSSAAKLNFYGGGVAAVAAGVADLALVEKVRGAPIPEEFEKDQERKNIYYASLDESLEPRKKRGRDAALVGLKKLAEVGVLADGRVREARRLLSKLYGGRRVDALDRLILPDMKGAAATTVEQRLARRLPTFYAGVLLDPSAATDPAMVSIFAEKGFPMAHRQALREGALPAEIAPSVASAYLGLGRTYWRTTDFESAAKAMTFVSPENRTPDRKLLAALAMALRNGPKDVVEMMVRSPLGMSSLGQRDALDALAGEKGPLSGAAAFDAAYITEITAPEPADKAFFEGLAKRYEAAAGLLADSNQKAEAQERAKAALAIASEIK